MPGPCFESETRERVKVPPAVAKAFANEMLDHLRGGPPTGAPELAAGAIPKEPLGYEDALKAMSEKSGLQPETINSILKRDPQVFSRTKQAIAKSGELRRMRDAADAFAHDLKLNGRLHSEPGMIAKTWDLQRRAALAGHSVVFPGTHMINWAVQIPTKGGLDRMGAFWQAEKNVWRYGGKKGAALYEMDMSLLRLADRYDAWKSSSLDVEPGKRHAGDILLQNRNPSWATRNFDALKPARLTVADAAYNRLDPALKEGDTGKAVMAMMSRDINYATGSIMTPIGEAATEGAKTASQLSNLAGRYNLLLATKLFFAKHMNAVFGPLEYLAKIPGGMTPAEKAAFGHARGMWANTVATHLAILGTNYAFNKAMGFKTPNISDPGDASTFLRGRAGNVIIPFSPMLETLRLPVVFAWALAHKGTDTAGNVIWRTLWNAAHPTAHTIAEQVTGKDYRGQPIPSIRNLIAPVKGYEKPQDALQAAKQVGEYASTRFTPIAISGALRELYQGLRDSGIGAGMSSAFIKAAIAGAASGIAGRHMFEKGEPKPKSGNQISIQ
jgi:hypothetical protein